MPSTSSFGMLANAAELASDCSVLSWHTGLPLMSRVSSESADGRAVKRSWHKLRSRSRDIAPAAGACARWQSGKPCDADAHH